MQSGETLGPCLHGVAATALLETEGAPGLDLLSLAHSRSNKRFLKLALAHRCRARRVRAWNSVSCSRTFLAAAALTSRGFMSI